MPFFLWLDFQVSFTFNETLRVFSVSYQKLHLVGNAITAIALLRDSKIRQHSTTAFILSLCISDWMFCSVCMPTTAAAFLNKVKWNFVHFRRKKFSSISSTKSVSMPLFLYKHALNQWISWIDYWVAFWIRF